MIDFQKLDLSQADAYKACLTACGERGCEYSLVNLYVWGRQRVALVNGYLALFSQFQRKSVYPFPVGTGDIGPVLDAILHDAQVRGLSCRLTSMTAGDCAVLEERYPGKFCFHPDRDGCDYIYSIEKLADLPGRKYQRKRNHVNRFYQDHPDCKIAEIDETMLPAVKAMTESWYEKRMADDPQGDYHMEQVALHRAIEKWPELGLEGLVLMENGQILAMTAGSFLNDTTFDVHFEKALDEGAYAVINQAFAQHLRKKYPDLQWLNREDDLGIAGLRKAKLSYYPDHLVVKFWAHLLEEDDEH
ncbi:MAG: DUF2156 domain-containing protein [Lentisphaeria bacterium]|nr:DUF2156 domain-containing protein [Lentisphaeria bacterium]